VKVACEDEQTIKKLNVSEEFALIEAHEGDLKKGDCEQRRTREGRRNMQDTQGGKTKREGEGCTRRP
jgi:hypothetical protein